jgi:hypothetical protein
MNRRPRLNAALASQTFPVVICRAVHLLCLIELLLKQVERVHPGNERCGSIIFRNQLIQVQNLLAPQVTHMVRKENSLWSEPQKSLLHESAAYTPANGISTKMRAGPDAVLFSPQNTPKEERHADWCVAIS